MTPQKPVYYQILDFGHCVAMTSEKIIPVTIVAGFTHVVGFLVILGQLSSQTGYNAQGANKPMQTLDLLLHVDQVHLPSLITGLIAIVLVVILQRTR